MSDEVDVSVVVSTYNRCALLPAFLEQLVAQAADAVRYEVLIVDNNSTDGTPQVVKSFIARGHSNVRYLFEAAQGVGHGRNAGIEKARAAIVAFTDDDVWVAPDWVAQIKRAFDEHPEVDCVGGKILPRWKSDPPAWLTRDHWAPLALMDYGDQPFYVNPRNPLCLLSSNLAFRREVIDRVGRFAPALQRVRDGIGSMEDHELLDRLWRAGGQGLYVPEIIATTEVPADRLTRQYHRKWHTGHGHFYALMRADEIERSAAGRLFDVPAHLYRQFAIDAAAWLKDSLLGRRQPAFATEIRLRFFLGFYRGRRESVRAAGQNHTARQLGRSAAAIAMRKASAGWKRLVGKRG